MQRPRRFTIDPTICVVLALVSFLGLSRFAVTYYTCEKIEPCIQLSTTETLLQISEQLHPFMEADPPVIIPATTKPAITTEDSASAIHAQICRLKRSGVVSGSVGRFRVILHVFCELLQIYFRMRFSCWSMCTCLSSWHEPSTSSSLNNW